MVMKNNKSFIIQEKEINKIVEFRLIDNEIIKGNELIKNKNIKLIYGLEDFFDSIIVKYKNDSILFLQ